MSHIFISYSRKDIDSAGKVVKALAEDDPNNSLDTWIDWKSIPKGEKWLDEIYRGIEEADAFLFLISPDSVASQMCNKEIAHAVQNGKRILPIVIRDTDPKITHPEISKRNWIFCREGQDDFDKAIEETSKTIHTDYEWLKYHTELQVKALKWEQKKDKSRLLRGKELREAEEQLARAGRAIDPQPTELNRIYVLASQRNEVRQRRQITLGLSLGLTLITIAGIFAWSQRNVAISETQAKATALVKEEQARVTAQAASTNAVQEAHAKSTAQADAQMQAKLAVSKKLVYQSQNLASGQNSIALLLAVEANTIHSDTSTLGGLLYALQAKPHTVKYFYFDNEDYTYAPEVVVFSPDNEYMAVLFDFWKIEKQKLLVWNVRTGQLEYEDIFAYDDLSIEQFFFIAQNLLLIETSDQQLHTLDIKLKHLSETILTAEILAASSDGTFFITLNTQGYTILDATTFSRLQVTPLKEGLLVGRGQYLLSSNGKYFVTVERYEQPSPYRKISIIELATGKVKNSFELPSGKTFGYFDIAISPDGSLVAYSIMNDTPINEVAVLDIETNIILWKVEGIYRNLGFFDDKTLVGDIQEEISFFNARTGQMLWQIDPPGVGFWSSDHFNADGKLLARPLFDSIVLVDLGSENLLSQEAGSFGGFITGMGFSQDNQQIYSTTVNGFIVHTDLFSGKNSQIFKVTDYDYGTKNWSNAVSAQEIAITVAADYTVDCWDIVSGTQLAHINNPTGSPIEDYSIHNNRIAIAYSDVVDGSSAGYVQIWDLDNQTQVDEFLINPDDTLYPYGAWINGIQFSPDGKNLAVAVYAGISIYNIETKKFIVHTPILHSNDIHKMAFSQDGRLLVSGSSDGSIILWEPATGQQIGKTIFANSTGVLAISPNGEILATGGNEVGQVLLWNTSTGEQVGLPFQGPSGYLTELVFNFDGTRLAAVDANGGITHWLLFPQELSDIACAIANRNLTQVEWNQYVGEVLSYQPVCPNLPIEPEITITPTP